MSSTFGDVTYDNSTAAASAPDQGAQAVAIDPNDPRLVSESLTDSGADAYAPMPTLPDGKWRAKATQLDIKDDKGQQQRYAVFSRAKMENGMPFFATNVQFSVIDHSGSFDGVQLTEYWVRTLIDKRKGTSQAATLTRKLGGKTSAAMTQQQVMQGLLTALAAEPECIIETAWQADCQSCQEKAKVAGQKSPRPFLTGMHRFPATREPGVHDPIVSCPVCHQQVKAQARIVGIFGLNETVATRGTGQSK